MYPDRTAITSQKPNLVLPTKLPNNKYVEAIALQADILACTYTNNYSSFRLSIM